MLAIARSSMQSITKRIHPVHAVNAAQRADVLIELAGSSLNNSTVLQKVNDMNVCHHCQLFTH